MQLIQVNPLDLQAPQAHLHALPEILGPAHGHPAVRSLARQAAFGGDDQSFRVWVECLRDQPFADLRAVGIRRVDEN